MPVYFNTAVCCYYVFNMLSLASVISLFIKSCLAFTFPALNELEMYYCISAALAHSMTAATP